ncbi:MAG: HD domain-containing protein [Halanaerobiales bacterium]
MQEWADYIQILKDIVFRKEIESYIVGGTLRDLFLVRSIMDIDISVKQRVEELARYFADKIEGSFVILDQERKIYRVDKDKLRFDFTLMNGKNIKEDLARRDFTINAIAYPVYTETKDPSVIENLLLVFSKYRGLTDYKKDYKGIEGEDGVEIPVIQIMGSRLFEHIIDPFNGTSDLKHRKIRATQKDVFAEDPLRLWRAIRFKGQLDFEIEKETTMLMKKFSDLAAQPARERIREEFIKILKVENTSQLINYLEKEFGLLSTIIPSISRMKTTGENKHHSEDAWTHSLLVLEALEEIIFDKNYRKHLDNDKIYLLKMASILHDIGKIATKSHRGEKIHYFGHEKVGAEMISCLLKGLKYSREEVKFVKNIIKFHMRPMLLYIAQNLTDKGRHKFFRQAGSLTPTVLIHSLADKTATMRINQREDEIADYREYINNMLNRYYMYKDRTEELLLTGKELIELFDIPEGPEIGELINKLADAQGSGVVKTKEEALNFLKGISD